MFVHKKNDNFSGTEKVFVGRLKKNEVNLSINEL